MTITAEAWKVLAGACLVFVSLFYPFFFLLFSLVNTCRLIQNFSFFEKKNHQISDYFVKIMALPIGT